MFFVGAHKISKISAKPVSEVDPTPAALNIFRRWVDNYSTDPNTTRAIKFKASEMIKGLKVAGAIEASYNPPAGFEKSSMYVYFAKYSTLTNSELEDLSTAAKETISSTRIIDGNMTTVVQFSDKDDSVEKSPLYNIGDPCPKACPQKEVLY